VTWLGNIDNFVSLEEAKQILYETDELLLVQEQPDSQEVLQSISQLSVGDLRSMNFEIPTKKYENVLNSGATMLENEVPHSNGIAYVDFSIDISNMDFDDVVLLPLFCRLLVQGGTGVDTGVEFQRKIDAETGGLTVEPLVDEIMDVGSDGGYVVPTGEHMETKIVVRTSCLAETACFPMFNLMRNVLYDSNVQNQAQAIEILKKVIDDMETDVQLNGHKYTTYRVQSQYGVPGFIREQWLGITQLLNLRRALQQARSNWSTLSGRLQLMADAMRRGHRNGMTISLTGDKTAITDIAGGVQSFFKGILPIPAQSTPFPDFGTTQHPWYTVGKKKMNDEVSAEAQNEAFLTPTLTNSVAKGGLLFETGEPIHGYDLVVLQYIGGYFLFKELRFGQGASDAKVVIDIDTGSVVYQSNQAPSIAETLKIYDQGVNFVLKELDGKSSLPPEAEGAVIGAIAQLDGTALQPSQVGYVALMQHLKQDTKTSRQKFRNEVLGAKVSEFLSMADRLGSWGKPTVAVVTNQIEYNIAVGDGLTLATCDITGLVC
jgi:Zn-dependent M16 (insulinase) family peptidase